MPIRPITSQDDAAVAALVRSCLQAAKLDQPGTAYFDPQLDHLSEFYAANPGRAYFVLVDAANQVIGGCGIGEYQGPVAELQKLYIAPSARGQGASHQLMQTCEDFAKQAGYTQVYLETHHNLGVAITLYAHSGYRQLPKPLHAGPHTTMDYFFIKDL
ncbi:GNAT family N-acetyltransferase [Lacticaseibacillus baoqingensis]|uniref:GNAT family N-acetyltransferase n=1 Tax=Lacticaseibacillus baoqingensis TaxID=2486013 RepID=A0ABW4E871_9LACO|nr:GNAT family N-acetyltransferase [Lacticaseibacillus baoqingensis]